MSLLKVRIADLFQFDLKALDLTKSTLGIAIVLIALILFSTIGAFGLTLAFGAALAVALDGRGSRPQRAAVLAVFAFAGGLVTLLGNGLGQNVWGSVIVVFVVTLVCGLALALGPHVGKLAFLVNLWMLFGLSLSGVVYDPARLALGFFCGSGSVALLLLLLPLPRSIAPDAPPSNPAPVGNLAALRAHLNLRSPIMVFALSRAVAAAFTMWLGWQLNLAHPYWIALTILIVVVPDRRQAALTSWQRGVGTILGVAIGALVLALNLPEITLLLLWLLVTLVLLAIQNVNYVLYATILTVDLILFYRLLEADVLFNGAERLITTLLGIVIALAIILILELLARRSAQTAPAE